MPNGHGETAADYAWDAARTAQEKAKAGLSQAAQADARVARLERALIAKGVLTAEEIASA